MLFSGSPEDAVLGVLAPFSKGAAFFAVLAIIAAIWE